MHFFSAQFVAMHINGAMPFDYFMQDIPLACKMYIFGWHASC